MCGVFSLSLADSEHGSRLFLAGQENAVVSIVLKAVLENNRARMPLMLWGPTGVGKT